MSLDLNPVQPERFCFQHLVIISDQKVFDLSVSQYQLATQDAKAEYPSCLHYSEFLLYWLQLFVFSSFFSRFGWCIRILGAIGNRQGGLPPIIGALWNQETVELMLGILQCVFDNFLHRETWWAQGWRRGPTRVSRSAEKAPRGLAKAQSLAVATFAS